MWQFMILSQGAKEFDLCEYKIFCLYGGACLALGLMLSDLFVYGAHSQSICGYTKSNVILDTINTIPAGL